MTQTIRRAARRQRYLIVDQAAVEDTRLSWAARGLLAYLLSRPDDWKVLVNDLRKRGDLGRDGIYRLLRELRNAGYVTFERTRDAKGRMRGGTYIVSEVPRPDSPDVDAPDLVEPRPANARALPKTHEYEVPTTTTMQTSTNGPSKRNRPTQQPRFPGWISNDTRTEAKKIVAALELPDAQLVIDEWAGALAADAIHSSPFGYLKALATKMAAGEMSVRYADGGQTNSS